MRYGLRFLKIRFLKFHLIWRTATPYAHIKQQNINLDPSTWVYGRTREGSSSVLKEQVRGLKEQYSCMNIMIIPEPCQVKAALILAKPSVQHEHKASELHFYLFLVELSPLTAKPMWLWIQQSFLTCEFSIICDKFSVLFSQTLSNYFMWAFVHSSLAKLQLGTPSTSSLTGGGGEGQCKKFELLSYFQSSEIVVLVSIQLSMC